MALQTIILSDLRTLIKREAKVEGSSNLDSWIDALVNELLTDFVLQKRYSEMLVTNEVITTIAGQENYALPDNFNFMRLVRYQATPPRGNIRVLNPRNENVELVGIKGLPRFYELVGTDLKVMPFEDTPADDSLLIDYYKYPDTLEAADAIPIPRLIAPIKLKAIYRTHIYNNNLQQAAALKGDSVEAETRSHTPND